ncbi:hypothetical protein ACJX0J_006510, partial [Zea mays]
SLSCPFLLSLYFDLYYPFNILEHEYFMDFIKPLKPIFSIKSNGSLLHKNDVLIKGTCMMIHKYRSELQISIIKFKNILRDSQQLYRLI